MARAKKPHKGGWPKGKARAPATSPIRLRTSTIQAIADWAQQQPEILTRPEAVERLIAIALQPRATEEANG